MALSPSQKAGGVLAAVLSAAAIAAPLLPQLEGWRNVPYRDVGGVVTACAGSTRGVDLKARYSDAACQGMMGQDLVRHGLGIAPCLPEVLPADTRAAFTLTAINIGAPAFCRSSMSRRALAGDLAGACAALDLYVYAAGQRVQGLANRRAVERRLCEKGLS